MISLRLSQPSCLPQLDRGKSQAISAVPILAALRSAVIRPESLLDSRLARPSLLAMLRAGSGSTIVAGGIVTCCL